MYKNLIRPLLFSIHPETVHHLLVRGIQLIFRFPLLSGLTRLFYEIKDERLTTHFCGIDFPNPVGLAAGFDKNAEVFQDFLSFGFGYIEIGTVTPQAQQGNPRPRLFRLTKDQALINRMGFNNNGVHEAIRQLKKRKNKWRKYPVGGNIGKNTQTPNEDAIQDYIFNYTYLYPHVDYFVINLSCPNIAHLDKLSGKESQVAIIQALEAIRAEQDLYKPLLLKISPDLSANQLDEIIEIYHETGIDGIVATNTTRSRDFLHTPGDMVESIGNGGLSGYPLKEKSTGIIHYLSRQTNGEMPIMAVGGIMTPDDAMEKLNAGATLVQIYTGFIYGGPGLVKRINKAILKCRKDPVNNAFVNQPAV